MDSVNPGAQLATAQRECTVRNRMKAMSHATRAEILMLLTERAMSPAELGKELGVALDSVSYHVRKLVDLECAELVRKDEVPGTGSLRHIYKATVRHHIADAQEWASMNETTGLAIATEVIQAMVDDFHDALEAGMIRPSEDLHLARTLHVLDDEGYRRVVEIQEEAREAILREQAKSAERLVLSGDQGRHFSTWHAAFEVPPAGQ